MTLPAPHRKAYLLGALLLLGALTLLAAHHAFQTLAVDTHAAASQDLLAALNLRRQQIESVLAERRGDTAILTTRYSISELLDPNTSDADREQARRTTARTIADFASAYGYKRIVLVDTKLQPVAGRADRRLTPAVAATLRAAMDSRQPLVVEIHRSEAGAMVYGMAGPIVAETDPTAPLLGAAYLEMDARGSAHGLVDPWQAARGTMQLKLLQRIGDRVDVLSRADDGRSPALSFETQRLDEAGPVINAALATPNNSVMEIADGAGGTVLAASAALTDVPWELLASIDASEIDSPARRLGWTIGASAATVLLCLTALAVVAWRRERDEQVLREAVLAQRYAMALAVMQDGLLRTDMAGRIVDANAAVCEMTGYSRDALLGKTLADLGAARMPEPPGNELVQLRWKRQSGEAIDVEMSTTEVADEGGGHAYHIVRDITAVLDEKRWLTRLNALHHLMIRAFQVLQHSYDPQEVLKEICARIDLGPSIRLVAALWVDREAGILRPIAAAGPAAGYLDEITITIDPALPTSNGPAGRCAREGKAVVASYTMQDPLLAPWHATAAKFGLASSISLPINVNGTTIAVLALSSGDESYFQGDEIDFVNDISKTMSLAVEAAASRHAASQLSQVRAASVARLNGLLRALPLPMHILSATNYEVRSVNAAFVRLFGYGPDEFATVSDWLDKVCTDREACARYVRLGAPAIAEAKATGEPERMPELVVRCKDGTVRIVQAYISVIGDDVLMAWADLTEIHAKQNALHRREAIHSAIVEATVNSILLIDVCGRFVEFNTAAHANLGYTREAFAAMRVTDISPHFAGSENQRRVKELAVGEGTVFEDVHVARGGQQRHTRVSVHCIMLDGRKCYASIWSDITEERRKTTALAAEAEKHRILFENAAQGILVFSYRTARIVQANATALRMFGCSSQEMLGTGPWEWNADYPDEASWSTRYRPPSADTSRTCRLRRRDGRAFDADIIWSLTALDGEPVAFISITDATLRLQTEKELRHAERLGIIGQLAGGIAHDFNNLLTVISLNLEVALEMMADDHRLRPMLATAQAAALRGGELNSQLMSYARRQTLRPLRTDIDVFLGPLREMASRAVGARHPIEHAPHGQLPSCKVDRAKLESAILNLIINARDAMPKGGTIRIETALVTIDASTAGQGRHNGPYVMISVKDHGTGMTREVREKALDPFFTTKEPGKGTGLGLSMVLGFVEQSGGFLEIDTELGQGTCIRLYLPAETEGMEQAAQALPPAWLPGPVRTLLVEDQDDVRAAAALMCRELGLVVQEAASADAALKVLRGDPGIELLFTDIVMPGSIGGAELGNAAQAMLPGLKVLYTSGHNQSTILADVRPGTGFLAKPYRKSQLVDALRHLLQAQDREEYPDHRDGADLAMPQPGEAIMEARAAR